MYCAECVVKEVWVRCETGEVTDSTYWVRTSDAVRLEVFAIETSGGLHREGRQFLRTHATAKDPHNPGLQFSDILKELSVAVQTARAKCVIIARDPLTLDTTPSVPFINSLLPVPPPG